MTLGRKQRWAFLIVFAGLLGAMVFVAPQSAADLARALGAMFQ
jgi:hypothetical protein